MKNEEKKDTKPVADEKVEEVATETTEQDAGGKNKPAPYEKKLKTIPVAQIQFDKEAMERQAKKIKNRLCSNGDVKVLIGGREVNPVLGVEKAYYNMAIETEGCQNKRRNGSKFCQDCSDKKSKEVTNDKPKEND